MSKSIYDLSVNLICGGKVNMSIFRQKTLLIVNVASQCGFTPQYAELEKLYQKYNSKGFIVLGFPCNQFGKQEPGNNEDIKIFCSRKYHVSFPMCEKIFVNGPHTHPLYVFLKKSVMDETAAKDIEWNFTKFLIDSSGQVLKRYAPNVTPIKIEQDILAQSMLITID